MKRTIRRQRNLYILALLLGPLVILLLGQGIYQSFANEGLLQLGIKLVIIETISITLVLLVIKKKYGKIIEWIREYQIKNSIDKNMFSIKAYEQTRNPNLFKTPNVIVEDELIHINMTNLDIRKKIEQYIDLLSTALPRNMMVRKTYLDQTGHTLTIEYDDTVVDRKLVFSNLNEYLDFANRSEKTQVRIDKKTVVNLLDDCHMLICGKTSAGKSYLTQLILIQMLRKGYVIKILDYKRSYQAFEDVAEFVSGRTEIIEELETLSNEIERRKNEMDQYLKSNPRAIAINCGFDPIYVIVEEYLAFLNSGLNSKTINHVNELLLNIISTGRSLGIHLLMVMQVSSAESLDTKIRSNLSAKLILGSNDETVYRTCFGLSNVPKIPYKFHKGDGIAMVDGEMFVFRTPTVNYSVSELNQI